MGKIEFESGIKLEHREGGEYIFKFGMPKISISSDPTRGHLKQAKKEILLAVRSIIDGTMEKEDKE